MCARLPTDHSGDEGTTGIYYQNRDTAVCFVCVVIPFILGVRLVDAPAGVTQEEGHIKFLHLPSAVLPLIFIARRIQPSIFLVDRGSRILCTREFIVLHL